MSKSTASQYARKLIYRADKRCKGGKKAIEITLCKGILLGGNKAERKAFCAEVLEGKNLVPCWNGYIPGNTIKRLKAGTLI